MPLQADNEFQQTKIKDLNKKYNDTVFTTSKRLSKIKEIFNQSKSKKAAATMIKLFADNINKVISEKYGIMPKNIETKLVSSEEFRTKLSFNRIKKSKKTADRIDKYDKNIYSRKKKQQIFVKMYL